MFARVVLTVMMAVLCSPSVYADGLVYQLPPDGHWARFTREGKTKDGQGNDVKIGGTVKLSSVGVVELDGQTHRWIEIEAYEKWGEHGMTIVKKLLIPEQQLKPGGTPLDHVKQYWEKTSTNPTPKKIDPEARGVKMQLDVLSAYLHGPFADTKKSSTVTIECGLGRLECPGLVAEDSIWAGGGVSRRFWIRTHRQAPFGVVAWAEEQTAERNGKPQPPTLSKLVIEACGDDAVSAMPEVE